MKLYTVNKGGLSWLELFHGRLISRVGRGVSFLWFDLQLYSFQLFAGAQLGTVFAMPISGYLCGSTFLGGWPSVFYVFGLYGSI